MLLNIKGLDALPADAPDVLPPARRTVPTTLHGAKEPSVEIQKEKAWHRLAAYMIASGAKIKTVAFETGYSEQQISLLNRQPWFQSLVTTIIHEEFGDDISKMLKGAASEAIMTVRDLATNGTSEAIKLKAATDILDRYRGKATNFVHHTNGALSEAPADELLRLEEELKITETKS